MAGSDHWCTPPRIKELVHAFLRPKLDPCSNPNSIMDAEIEWFGPPGTNGLLMPWVRDGLVYVNCPFSAKAIWMRKCHEEAARGSEIVALIPADTDTDHWHRHVVVAPLVCFLRGRDTFVGEKDKPDTARFPTALVYWGDCTLAFGNILTSRGHWCV